jgi:uncharacterized OB-fold protein
MRVPASQNWTAWKGHIPVGSLYTAGIAGQAFLEALKGKGEILGSPCAKCNLVYVPATIFCERCFDELEERQPVGPEGEVVTFTLCHLDLEGNRLDPPQIATAVRLDGATSVLVHRGLGDPSAWRIGARAKVKLASQRKGSIRDIEGFELI